MTAEALIASAEALRDDLETLRFGPPVTHVYNPLVYAMESYAAYLRRFATGPRRVVFLGMNPGPWGMAQAGVPFGNVELVRDWLQVPVTVSRPAIEHPKRPVMGLDCTRREVSGDRLWGAIRDHFGTPERFFARNLIANYCPLMFMEESGRNRTPDKLAIAERRELYAACDRHLQRLADVLQPEWIIGIGSFAAERAEAALADRPILFGRIMHPSPANPQTNQGWAGAVERELAALGVCPL